MPNPTLDDLLKKGEFVEQSRGSSWNDGGAWSRTIYQLDGCFWRVYCPSDYQPNDVKITEVLREKRS